MHTNNTYGGLIDPMWKDRDMFTVQILNCLMEVT